MVSTDKAVNPTSVMGATKRLAELYVQGLASTGSGGTSYSMVRFGNVIGSACSVMQIWSSQLAEGGPITVTDPRMTRYFMTIPEAAGLVMQAGALEPAVGAAPVYVLDMGEPVRILDLAKRFVRAHGFEPRVVSQPERRGEVVVSAVSPTIDIVFTGIRPGEKLHEELAYEAELLARTTHPAIRAWSGCARTAPDVSSMVRDLSMVDGGANRTHVISVIRRHLPELASAA
jgi:FlaA1/EpsC-like NDP-sugar epimerase